MAEYLPSREAARLCTSIEVRIEVLALKSVLALNCLKDFGLCHVAFCNKEIGAGLEMRFVQRLYSTV